MTETIVLAAASTYDKKYYLNPMFNGLPETIQNTIKIMCVGHVADVGGIIMLQFDSTGALEIKAEADEEDVLYDEIGSHLKIKKIILEEQELLKSLELYHKTIHLGLS